MCGKRHDFDATVQPEPPVDDQTHPEELQDEANSLAKVMRRSLKLTWNKPFEFDRRNESSHHRGIQPLGRSEPLSGFQRFAATG